MNLLFSTVVQQVYLLYWPVVLLILLTTAFLPVSAHAEKNGRPVFKQIRDKLKDGSWGPELIVLPAGKVTMGDVYGDGLNDEGPVHEVTITKAFAIGKFETTFEQFDKFCADSGFTPPGDEGWGRKSRPVIQVSYFDVKKYLNWLSLQTGQSYRLPTEAEWAYAGRAGTTSRYWWGDELQLDKANCLNCDSSGSPAQETRPVGSYAANPFGLYDTVGNVWEWTASIWTLQYHGTESRFASPGELETKTNHMQQQQLALRGGSWNLYAKYNRSTSRYYSVPQAKSKNLGFRVVRELGP